MQIFCVLLDYEADQMMENLVISAKCPANWYSYHGKPGEQQNTQWTFFLYKA